MGKGMLDTSKRLKRKPNPVVADQVDRNGLNNIDRILANSGNESVKIGVRSKTERATIKVDNHTRNILTALVNIGRFDSQKDAVEKLCNREIEDMDDEERKRFDFILDTLELKDYTKQQRRK